MLPSSAKEAFEKFSFTTLLVFYLFLCGALYLIGFWIHFNFDVTAFINALDIPKAAVQTFSNIQFTFTAIGFLYIQLSFFMKLKGFLQALIAMVAFGILSVRFLKGNHSDSSYTEIEIDVYTTYFCLQVPIVFALDILFGKMQISPTIRVCLILFFWFPVYCLAGGLVRGTSIKSNTNISIVENLHSGDTTYKEIVGKKLVGFVGDKIVLSSIDNQHYYLINQSSLDIIRFTDRIK